MVNPSSPKAVVPPLRCQKRPTGRHDAFVILDGKRIYVGPYGAPETEQAYHRMVAEYLANGSRLPVAANDITVAEVAERYLTFAQGYYRKSGLPTSEVKNIPLALRPLVKLYGRTPAAEFGPRALKAVRQTMIDGKVTRKYINRHVDRIKRMFKWAVSEEIVPGTLYYQLQTVAGLKYGRSEARETDPVKPAMLDLVEGVKKVVSRQVAAMIDLQLLTGARPGEILIMRPIDIDTSGPVWTYRPSSHKTQHHGHERIIPLGPQARAIVEPFLLNRPLHAYLFSPLEAEAERYAQMQARSKSPATLGLKAMKVGRKLRSSTRALGDHYDRTSYARTIARACEVAFPPPAPLARLQIQCQGGFHWEAIDDWKNRLGEGGWKELKAWTKDHHWHPHQLRHNFATAIRKAHGLEVAQILLGHSKADVTQIYAERDLNRAMDVAAKIG